MLSRSLLRKEESYQHEYLEITLPAIKFLFFLDIPIRLLIAYLFFFKNLNAWLFLFLSILMPLTCFFIKQNKEKKHLKTLDSILPKEKRQPFPYTRFGYDHYEIWGSIYIMIGLLISFWFMIRIIGPEHWYTYILIFFLSIIMTALHVLIPEGLNIPIRFEPLGFRIMRELKKKETESLIYVDISDSNKEYLARISAFFEYSIPVDPTDINDTNIARLESNLKDINSKMDAYMLESALIGTLAFSGFLAIISGGVIKELSTFFSEIGGQMKYVFGNGNISTIMMRLDQFSTDKNLFPLVMIGSLFCSAFFILILILRTRINTLALKFDYLIRVMGIFNAKEEELINMEIAGSGNSQIIEKRKKIVSTKISETIKDATLLYGQIRPVMIMMSIYRNVGLVLFFCVLIISGLFISSYVCTMLMLLALFTVVYRIIETKMRGGLVNRILYRH